MVVKDPKVEDDKKRFPEELFEPPPDCRDDDDIACECSNEECRLPKRRECKCDKLEDIVKEKEQEMKNKYNKRLDKEVAYLKNKFDLIMDNERARTFALLHSAQHEKHEKIRHLRTKLECKNMSGMMYVLCTERRKSKVEKQKIIEEFSECIEELALELEKKTDFIYHILKMFKSASTVDKEWRCKTGKLINEFQKFIEHYFGSSPEVAQFFFDPEKLNALKSALEPPDDSDDDTYANDSKKTCTCEKQPSRAVENDQVEEEEELAWWQKLEQEKKPFVVYADMVGFSPDIRKNVYNNLKEARLQEEFNEFELGDKYLQHSCQNLNLVLNKCIQRLKNAGVFIPPEELPLTSMGTCEVHIPTTVTMQNTLKSLIKGVKRVKTEHTAIIGAKDSFEIASSLLHRKNISREEMGEDCSNFTFCIQKKRESVDDMIKELKQMDSHLFLDGGSTPEQIIEQIIEENPPEEVEDQRSFKPVQDSIQMVYKHSVSVDKDQLVEKDCPDSRCRYEKAQSFVSNLPGYMKHMECSGKSFDNYEPCTKEQLQQLFSKAPVQEAPSSSQSSYITDLKQIDVGVQTSALTSPDCTCDDDSWLFHTDILFHEGKMKMDRVPESRLYDNRIDFKRFKVLGQDVQSLCTKDDAQHPFKIPGERLHEKKSTRQTPHALWRLFSKRKHAQQTGNGNQPQEMAPKSNKYEPET